MSRFFWVGPKVCLGFSVLQDNPNELMGQLDTIAGYTYHAVHHLWKKYVGFLKRIPLHLYYYFLLSIKRRHVYNSLLFFSKFYLFLPVLGLHCYVDFL